MNICEKCNYSTFDGVLFVLHEKSHEITELRTLLAEVRKALKPFVDTGASELLEKNPMRYMFNIKDNLNVDDFRRVAELYKRLEAGE